ncbi:MAG: Glu/Leu/Phe/Val dehydrogenase, partial [Bacteroidota bacterium]
MEKRFQEIQTARLVDAVEKVTKKKLDKTQRNLIIHGADERDLVSSGLEETMIAAYNEIRNIRVSNPKIHDLRTAAFVSGINKLAASYNALGFWP